MLNNICNFIINKVIEDTSGFQYCVDFEIIENHFNISLNKKTINSILNELIFHDLVADVIVDKDCFDIVLYTSTIKGC